MGKYIIIHGSVIGYEFPQLLMINFHVRLIPSVSLPVGIFESMMFLDSCLVAWSLNPDTRTCTLLKFNMEPEKYGFQGLLFRWTMFRGVYLMMSQNCKTPTLQHTCGEARRAYLKLKLVFPCVFYWQNGWETKCLQRTTLLENKHFGR